MVRAADASERISRECLGLVFHGTCTFDTKSKAMIPWLLIVTQWETCPILTGFSALYKEPDFELLVCFFKILFNYS